MIRLIDSQNKVVTEFEAEREKLMTNHREKMTEQTRHYEEPQMRKSADSILNRPI